MWVVNWDRLFCIKCSAGGVKHTTRHCSIRSPPREEEGAKATTKLSFRRFDTRWTEVGGGWCVCQWPPPPGPVKVTFPLQNDIWFHQGTYFVTLIKSFIKTGKELSTLIIIIITIMHWTKGLYRHFKETEYSRWNLYKIENKNTV